MRLIYKEVVVRAVDSKETGRSARESRMAMEVSLREMARRLKVSPAYISDLELGRRAWSERFWNKYEEALYC